MRTTFAEEWSELRSLSSGVSQRERDGSFVYRISDLPHEANLVREIENVAACI